jgi:hypothetical protein
MIEATTSCEPLGTTESTLRMKCSRRRCQDAPWNTVPIVFFDPEWVSDISSFTLPSPRVLIDRDDDRLRHHTVALQVAVATLTSEKSHRTSGRDRCAVLLRHHGRTFAPPQHQTDVKFRGEKVRRRGAADVAGASSHNSAYEMNLILDEPVRRTSYTQPEHAARDNNEACRGSYNRVSQILGAPLPLTLCVPMTLSRASVWASRDPLGAL